MLKAVIDNIDVYLSTLGLKTEGLAEKVDFNGEDMPCVYLTGKEYKPINPEVSTIYHRIISGPSRTTEESPVYDDEIQTLRWSMRAVAIFENGIYGEDINGIEDKVIQNIMAAMYDASAVDGVAKALGLSILSYSPNDSNRGREAWRAEFSTPWTGWRRIVAVDYDLTLQAFESCFIAQGCDKAEIDIIQIIIGEYCEGGTCADGSVTLNAVAFGSVPSGGTLAGLVQYVSGTPVGSLVGAIWTIPNPVCADVTTTINSSAYSILPSGGTQNVLVSNSLSVPIGVVTPGVGVDIGDMTIDYPDGTTAAVVVVPGGTIVTAPLWSIQLSGAVASPVTVTAPAWDSSFVCSAQTATGGTITQITVNGGAPVASLVGVAIPASAVLVVTFTGSLTQILLAF